MTSKYQTCEGQTIHLDLQQYLRFPLTTQFEEELKIYIEQYAMVIIDRNLTGYEPDYDMTIDYDEEEGSEEWYIIEKDCFNEDFRHNNTYSIYDFTDIDTLYTNNNIIMIQQYINDYYIELSFDPIEWRLLTNKKFMLHALALSYVNQNLKWFVTTYNNLVKTKNDNVSILK
jgi:hypothetical protein